MRFTFKIAIVAAALGALSYGPLVHVATSPALAAEGGGEELTGNNLSFPLVFGDGIGLLGLDVAEDPSNTGLRGVPGEETLEGEFWWGWPDDEGAQVACKPGTTGCPPSPSPAGIRKIFVQQDPANSWQADWMDGRELATPFEVAAVDWGDNLESQTWTPTSVIRTEVTLYADRPSTGYEMWYLTGQGPSEVHGASAVPMANPAVLSTYESSQATVYSPCARFTIQKLQNGPGAIDAKPDPAGFRWDAARSLWRTAGGADLYVLHNGAVWQGIEAEGRSDKYSAEVNVSGKAIFGYNWLLRSDAVPLTVNKTGWYRLTFSLDGTEVGSAPARACGDFELNTSLAKAEIVPPAEEEGEDEGPAASAAAEDDGEGGEPDRPSYTPVVDHAQNLTYIDIYVTSRTTGRRLDQSPGRGVGGITVPLGRRGN